MAAGREGELVDGPGAEAGAVQGVTPRLRLGGVHRHPGPGLTLDIVKVVSNIQQSLSRASNKGWSGFKNLY